MKIPSGKLSFLFLIGPILLLTVSQVRADDSSSNPISVNTGQAVDDIFQDSVLERPVSFEVRSCALPQLLVQLKHLTGVDVHAGDASTTGNKLVTACVTGMKLGEVLKSLTRLYGVTWLRTGANSYLMKDADDKSLDVQLLPMGDIAELQHRDYARTSADNKKEDLGAAILKSVTMSALLSPQGVLLSSLPLALQTRIRKLRQRSSELRLIKAYCDASPATEEAGYVHVEMPRMRSLPKVIVPPIPALTPVSGQPNSGKPASSPVAGQPNPAVAVTSPVTGPIAAPSATPPGPPTLINLQNSAHQLVTPLFTIKANPQPPK